MLISKTNLYLLGLFTLIGFTASGWWIIWYFSDGSFFDIFNTTLHWILQLIIGFIYGIISAIIAWKLIMTDMMIPPRIYFMNLLRQLNLSVWNIIFISFCAGVGEEALFRGAIQPHVGVLITSIVFVAIHGYLNPWNWRLSIYGLLMCVIIIGIGIMKEYFGILPCMSAHFAFDFFLLIKMVRK